MELITRESLASEAIEAFSQQYTENIGDKRDILNKLKSLGHKPNPDDVDKAIGNMTWTKVPACNECKKCCSKVLAFEDDFYTLYLCEDCINKASESI